MKKINVGHYQAFSRVPKEGNPAGVVLDSDDLTTEEMQRIAQAVGFNETVFVLKPQHDGDYRLRYFTPGHEMDLCGHGTMAAVWGIIQKYGAQATFLFETNVGILKVDYQEATEEIVMEQASANFRPFGGDTEAVCQAIGITSADLDSRYPIMYGSTGIWTLLVPVKTVASCEKMMPRNALFSTLLTEIPHASIHPFSLEVIENKADMHGRHFSSSFSGTKEDAVTGTASGVMGAYYLEYIAERERTSVELLVEQGHEIGRPGQVQVKATNEEGEIKVKIAGVACFVEELEVSY